MGAPVTWRVRLRAARLLVVADREFRRGKWLVPFAGLGVGVAANGEVSGGGGSSTDVCVLPRVGARLFGFLGVTVDYALSRSSHDHFNVKLGYYL
jgi:hypothetical protein